MLLAGCAAPAPKPVAQEKKPEPWLSDGRLGVRVMDGGARLRIFRESGYEPGGEERLRFEMVPLLPPSAARFEEWRLDPKIPELVADGPGGRRARLRLGNGQFALRMDQPNAAPTYVGPEEIWSEAQAGPNEPRIEVESERPEDQARLDRYLAFLRMSAAPGGTRAPAPMALSSELYGGHVFWDADVWVFPALALLWPDRARTIPAYRLRLADQARANYRAWIQAGRPTAGKPLGPLASPPEGIKYPWESSVSGRETCLAPTRFEDHITGSVAFMLGHAARLGLADPAAARRVIREAASFYRARSVPTPAGRSIPATVSPDEHHTGDDDLYTNLLAEWCARGGTFDGPAKPLYLLPRDGKGALITYANDAERGYKQAAAVLAAFPLEFPEAARNGGAMVDRFGPKVTRNGPAMTDAIHATLLARAGRADDALAALDRATLPFERDGWFSEKRSSDRTVFVTGVAGAVNAVLYGFAGMRFGDDPARATPHLPKSWRSLTLRNLTYKGRRLDLLITPSGARVRAPRP